MHHNLLTSEVVCVNMYKCSRINVYGLNESVPLRPSRFIRVRMDRSCALYNRAVLLIRVLRIRGAMFTVIEYKSSSAQSALPLCCGRRADEEAPAVCRWGSPWRHACIVLRAGTGLASWLRSFCPPPPPLPVGSGHTRAASHVHRFLNRHSVRCSFLT